MTDLNSHSGVASELRRSVCFDIRPHIGGSRRASQSDGAYEKFNPADGSLLTRFAPGSADDVDLAVGVARATFEAGVWSRRPQTERREVLLGLADLLARDREALAALETVEVGKPLAEAHAIDLPIAETVLRNTAIAADQLCGSTYPTDSRSLALTIRAPVGVVAAIVAWNFPIALAIQKLAPALIVGNSVILKPSELTSEGALRLADLAMEAGVPEGVLNVTPGLGSTVGAALASHMDVDLVSFTGSTNTGRLLLGASGASNMKRLVLECGGKSANIVFADAPDIDGVADGVFARMFTNQGQVCSAGTRLIVHESLCEVLVEKLVERTERLVIGDPLDTSTTFGPLISAPQRDRVLAYISEAIRDGSRARCGGAAPIMPESGGYFVAPTILLDVDPRARIAQEEVFGPVLCVHPFSNIDEAIAIANRTNYGLAATAWTQTLDVAQRIVREVKAGEIVIHATTDASPGASIGAIPIEPRRQSGLGLEGGLEGIAAFTALTTAQIFT